MIERVNLKEYPTTRYQGSKRKILPWIFTVIKDLKFKTVLDGCGGSSSVSYLFKKMNKHVTYNDKLKFNYLIGKALIENHSTKLFDEDLLNLLRNSNNNIPKFIGNNFDDIYFLRKENNWLDKTNFGIMNMNHYTGKELEYKKSIAYYALFQASLIKRPFNLFHRKNLDIRTNDVERNFGNKTTWDRSFQHYFKTFVNEANSLIFNSNKECISTNYSIFDVVGKYDLVYIDPPYLNKDGKNESSDYLKCYHFLEGVANYEKWEELIDYETRNLRFKNIDEYNDFKVENIYKTYNDLFNKFKKSTIVLSYKNGGTPSIDFLVETMKKYKNHVTTKSMQYSYALNKQNGDSKKNREFLIIGI